MGVKDKLYKGYEHTKAEEKKQQELREKHGVGENITIVEKPMIGKFLLSTAGNIVVWLARTLLVMLAFIGVISLLYPQIREVLFTVLRSIVTNVLRMVGV